MTHHGKTFLAAAIAAALALFLASDAHGEGQPRLNIPDYRTADPVLSRALATPQCPSDGIVAFTAVGEGHVSEGNATLLGYPSTYNNVGGGWTPGGGTFIAPCSGLHSFTVSFVRDPYYYGGTYDDVYVYIYRNGIPQGYGWAGQTTATGRATGTHTVALVLNAGDYVQSFAASDGGYKRHLGTYEFTGFLVRLMGTPNP